MLSDTWLSLPLAMNARPLLKTPSLPTRPPATLPWPTCPPHTPSDWVLRSTFQCFTTRFSTAQKELAGKNLPAIILVCKVSAPIFSSNQKQYLSCHPWSTNIILSWHPGLRRQHSTTPLLSSTPSQRTPTRTPPSLCSSCETTSPCGPVTCRAIHRPAKVSLGFHLILWFVLWK